MDHEAWIPHGRALWDYFEGDLSAAVVVHSDLGEREELPVAVWFREPAGFWDLERAALELCRGRVLDVGAGTGCHSLALQERGLYVCAIDVVPEAVEIMRRRGVRETRRADLFELEPEAFDTILMLSNGVGLVETLLGLDRFLRDVGRLLSPGGQILLDSTDVRPPPAAEAPHAPGLPLREDGRYAGEIHFQLEYRGQKGAPFPQLYVDADTLADRAASAGWACIVIARGSRGAYLARLTRSRPPVRR